MQHDVVYYSIRQKSNKHYMNIIYYCFGISFTNPWLIYRRHILTQHFQKAVIHIVSVSKPNSK